MRFALRAMLVTATLFIAYLSAPVPAYADGEYIRVTPSTIQAGYQVHIDAFCSDNVNPATVESDAFGVVTIPPVPDPEVAGRYLHRGTVTIPPDKPNRTYHVTITCPSQQRATTSLHVVNNAPSSKGPNTGGGYLAGNKVKDGTLTMIWAGAAALALGAMLFAISRRRKKV